MAAKTSKTSKTSNQNATAELLASFTPEQIEALAKFAALVTGKQDAQTEAKTEAPTDSDLDARLAKRKAANEAIIATIPAENRALIRARLTALAKAGYPLARLERNKKHQLDGLHIYPGEKGRGREAAFMECTTKPAKDWAAKRDEAKKSGKAAPKPLSKKFCYSPVGGGNLYARGIFGDIQD